MPYSADPYSISNRYRHSEGLHHVSIQSMSLPSPQSYGPPPSPFFTYVAGPPPGNYYATVPSAPTRPPPPAYWPGPPPGYTAYDARVQWVNVAPPQPPPPRPSKRVSVKAKGPYKTAKVKTLKIHVLTPRRNMSPSDIFRRAYNSPSFQGFDLPTSMTVPDLFRTIGAKGEDAVVEEAVEEGDGVWSRGAKLVWGKPEKDMTIGAVRWKRGVGLAAAAGEPIWVLCRPRQRGDE